MKEAQKSLKEQVTSCLEEAIKIYESTKHLPSIKKPLDQSVFLAYLIFFEEYCTSKEFKDPIGQLEALNLDVIAQYERAINLYTCHIKDNRISKKYLNDIKEFFELTGYTKEASILSEFYSKHINPPKPNNQTNPKD